jgi:hypothetical protein
MTPIDSVKLLDAACQWMLDRNWHQLMGKLGSYTQSLYHHTAAQINFLLALRALLCGGSGLSLTEDQFLAVFAGSLCHDAGKEDPEWQRALLRGAKLPHHVDEKRAHEAAIDWAQRLGLSERPGFVSTVVAAICLHHKATQGAASTLDQLLRGGQTDPRWRELADLVEATDKISSTADVAEAAEIAGKWFGKGIPLAKLAVTFHEVQVLRGVSTTLVHRACQEAHVEAGWTPAMHFADGTLYFSLTGSGAAITELDVRSKLIPLFARLLSGADLAQQVVGNLHGGEPMPRPELFDPSQFSAYLKVAASRNKPANFRKKHKKADGSFSDEFLKYLAKYRGFFCTASDHDDSGTLFERFVMAVPLDSMFRFFKEAVLGDKVISEEDWPLGDAQLAAIESAGARKGGNEEQKATVRDREEAKERKRARDAWLGAVKQTYEEQFGFGSFEDLASVTNDPPINLAKAVDYFLEQEVAPGDGTGIRWSSKPPQEQEVEVLARLDKVFGSSEKELPQGVLAPALDGDKLAEIFLGDVQIQGRGRQIDPEVQRQSYLSAKEEDQAQAFCPFSNEPAGATAPTGSGLGVATAGHSNRLPIQGNNWQHWRKAKTGGGVQMGAPSRCELMLRGMILGRPTEQLIVLMPPAQLGAFEGARLVEQVRRLEEEIALYSGEFSPDPARRFSFSLTEQIAARALQNQEAPLADLLRYSSSAATTQKHKKDLDKSLREVFSGSVESLNEECGTSFADWTAAMDALFSGQSAEAKLALQNSDDIRVWRKQSLNLTTQGRFVCQTPNMILVLLPNAISLNKESDVNSAIRQLFLSLVLNHALGVSVAVIPGDEALTFSRCEGSVLVPSNPALRAEVARARRGCAAAGNPVGVTPTHEWLLPHETLPWLRALAALHELGREHPKRSAGKASNVSIFPQRSAFYDILAARSAGFVLRRMEDKLARPVRVDEMRQLEILQPFLG